MIITGFKDLDLLINGFNPGDLIVLGGRPGMGKTSFALEITRNVAMNQCNPVHFFSLEMSCEQVERWLLLQESQVNVKHVLSGEVTEKQKNHMASVAKRLADAPIYIDDECLMTVSKMKAKLQKENPIGLVIIDYLQLMSDEEKSRPHKISEMVIAHEMKRMAEELHIPVLVCAQISKAVDRGNGSHRPQLSHLNIYGSVDTVADVVLFLYRDWYYNSADKNADENSAECIVAKNRNDSTGTVPLRFNSEYISFSSCEQPPLSE